MSVVADVLARFRADTSDLDSGASRSEAALRSLNAEGDRTSTVLNSLRDTAGVVGAALGGALAGGVVEAISLTNQYITTIESLDVSLTALLGKPAATTKIDQITEFATKLGLPIEAVGQMSNKLELLTQGQHDNVATWEAITNAAAGTGKSVDSVAQSLGFVYEMLQREGTTTAGRGAYTLLRSGIIGADTLNEVSRLAKQGADLNTIWDALIAGMQRFQGAGEAQAQTMKGLTATFHDLIEKSAGTAFGPIEKGVESLLSTINKAMQSDGFKGFISDIEERALGLETKLEGIGGKVSGFFSHFTASGLDDFIAKVHSAAPELGILIGYISEFGAAFLADLPLIGQFFSPFLGFLEGGKAGLLGFLLSSKDTRDAVWNFAMAVGDGVKALVGMASGAGGVISALSPVAALFINTAASILSFVSHNQLLVDLAASILIVWKAMEFGDAAIIAFSHLGDVLTSIPARMSAYIASYGQKDAAEAAGVKSTETAAAANEKYAITLESIVKADKEVLASHQALTLGFSERLAGDVGLQATSIAEIQANAAVMASEKALIASREAVAISEHVNTDPAVIAVRGLLAEANLRLAATENQLKVARKAGDATEIVTAETEALIAKNVVLDVEAAETDAILVSKHEYALASLEAARADQLEAEALARMAANAGLAADALTELALKQQLASDEALLDAEKRSSMSSLGSAQTLGAGIGGLVGLSLAFSGGTQGGAMGWTTAAAGIASVGAAGFALGGPIGAAIGVVGGLTAALYGMSAAASHTKGDVGALKDMVEAFNHINKVSNTDPYQLSSAMGAADSQLAQLKSELAAAQAQPHSPEVSWVRGINSFLGENSNQDAQAANAKRIATLQAEIAAFSKIAADYHSQDSSVLSNINLIMVDTGKTFDEVVAKAKALGIALDFSTQGRSGQDDLHKILDSFIPGNPLSDPIANTSAARNAELAASIHAAQDAAHDAQQVLKSFDDAQRVVQRQRELEEATLNVEKALRNQAKAAQALVDAHQAVDDAMRGEQKAAQALLDAQQGVTDALWSQQKAAQALTDAHKSLDTATASLANNQSDLAANTKHFHDVMSGVVDDSYELDKTTRDLTADQKDLGRQYADQVAILQSQEAEHKRLNDQYKAEQDQVTTLTDLQKQYQDVMNTPLKGTGEYNDKLEANKEQQDALQLDILRRRQDLSLTQPGLAPGDFADDPQIAAWNLKLSQLKLVNEELSKQKDVDLGPQQYTLDKLSKSSAEFTFDEKKQAAANLGDVTTKLNTLNDTMHSEKAALDAANSSYDAQKQKVDALRQALEAIVTTNRSITQSVEEIARAQMSVVDSERSLEASSRSVEAAERRVVDAQYAQADAARQTQAATRGVQDAEYGVVDAAHAVQTAQEAVQQVYINMDRDALQAQVDIKNAIVQNLQDEKNALADTLAGTASGISQWTSDVETALNPLLRGIGVNSSSYSPDKPLTYDPASYTFRAAGGAIPGVGSGDTVPAMLTPGEYVNRQAIVAAQGVGKFDALNSGMADIVMRGYADGGEVTASDIPMPPDFSSLGNFGVAGNTIDKAVYDKVVAYLGGQTQGGGDLGSSPHTTPSPSGDTPSGEVSDWVAAGVALAGKPGSWTPPEVNIAMFESGGDPHAQNNWDSNALAGTPSMGLMQTIQSTFDAYAVAGHTDIWNPIDNVAAATNYIESRYGDPWNTPGERALARGEPYQGYENGGIYGANFDTGLAQLWAQGDGIRVSNEANAGGEAYIPLGLNKRSSALPVLNRVMDEFGLNSPGAATFPHPTSSSTLTISEGAVKVSITIDGNAPADIGQEIAERIEEALAQIMAAWQARN